MNTPTMRVTASGPLLGDIAVAAAMNLGLLAVLGAVAVLANHAEETLAAPALARVVSEETRAQLRATMDLLGEFEESLRDAMTDFRDAAYGKPGVESDG